MANTVRWTIDHTGMASGYYIYRSDEQYVDYSRIAEVGHPTGVYIDESGQYRDFYRVSMWGSGGESPLSAPFIGEGDREILGSLTYYIDHEPGSDTVYVVTSSGQYDDNYEYTVTVASGLLGIETNPTQEEYSFSFTSQYYPIYTTPTWIRSEIGPFIATIPEDTLYRMIHRNAVHAELRAQQIGVVVDRNNPDYYLVQWVICKTELDAINAIIMSFAPTGGRKTLGDLTVEYDYNMDMLNAARKGAIDCIDKYEGYFRKNVDTAIPHLNDPRPHPPYSSRWGRFPTAPRKDRFGNTLHTGPQVPSITSPRWSR